MREERKMNQRISALTLCAMILALCTTADAQKPKKIALVCHLGGSASNTATDMKPFRERLRELGYAEGQNIAIESRTWDGKVERLAELAAELVRRNCDVILTSGTEASQAAKNATKTVPIVMGFSGDAVGLGIVASLARPGGNVTGMTSMGAELYGKRLELLKEVLPKLSRVAFLWSPSNRDSENNVKQTEPVARFLRLEIQPLEVKGIDDIEIAFRAATKRRAEALTLAASGFFGLHRTRIVELAEKYKLPAVYPTERFVEVGALMVYAPDRLEQFRRAAEYVDKILKGAKPADLPVEQPKKFDFIINLKAAKQIGLTIPPNVLARADRVIR
jgi:putative ABC transport system substrate-binding protein